MILAINQVQLLSWRSMTLRDTSRLFVEPLKCSFIKRMKAIFITQSLIEPSILEKVLW